MRAVKRINNNIVLCISKKGTEFIARGKGIGFHEFPYELSIKDVEKTYYDVDPGYYTMIDSIPEEILTISSDIVDYATDVLDCPLTGGLVFTLADHIQFAIERSKKHINIKLPIANDIEYLFDEEYKIGCYGLKLIRKKTNIYLPDEEASFIALHIINAKERSSNKQMTDDKVIDDIIKIIEHQYNLVIEQNFNYSRFVSHLHYLLKRGKSNDFFHSDNKDLFDEIKDSYPQSYICSLKIGDYLKDNLQFGITEEELLYLMLHINRLCTREECYQ